MRLLLQWFYFVGVFVFLIGGDIRFAMVSLMFLISADQDRQIDELKRLLAKECKA